MNFSLRTSVFVLCMSVLCVQGYAQDADPNELALQYRQAHMTLVGQNFGPMAAMIKGEIPWDDNAFKGFAEDLEMIAQLNIMRGYRDGSHKGRTKAKPEAWEDKEDFKNKTQDMAKAAMQLAKAAQSGDRKEIVNSFKDAGGTCKSCHDDYKSKDYLN